MTRRRSGLVAALLALISASGGILLPVFSEAAESRAASSQQTTLSIGVKGAELAFDKTKLNAKAGQTVKLTFTNGAPKDSGLQHNWVLVNPGKADSVGEAGIAAGPGKGYLPDSPDVLAKTRLLNPGEKDTIEFKAPAKPGDYPFICTFPGHHTVMKGILTVK